MSLVNTKQRIGLLPYVVQYRFLLVRDRSATAVHTESNSQAIGNATEQCLHLNSRPTRNVYRPYT